MFVQIFAHEFREFIQFDPHPRLAQFKVQRNAAYVDLKALKLTTEIGLRVDRDIARPHVHTANPQSGKFLGSRTKRFRITIFHYN